MSPFETIALALTSNALALAVLGWLAKSLIQNLLTKDLAEHRIRLELENERASQAFGHELALAAREHDITFSKLHQRRAQTVAKLYELLSIAAEKGSNYSTPISYSNEPSKPELFAIFANAFNEAAKYFYSHKLFLPEESCAKIEELFQGLKTLPSKMNTFMAMAEMHKSPEMEIKSLDAWNEAWKYFEHDLKPAMALLERDFRLLLGDKPPSAL
ncbi:hypothetical protein [Stenotrophomonas maltophilia]|uniref:hypothetical protein n=1 Tax=Stenotrophomonas maltophilia TaxID=40324 RepID=UPI0025538375|nr:hypothetical protein [Stenotrophomonas maltophilia]